MGDSLLDPLAQVILDDDGFDCLVSNDDLNFSLPPHLFSPLPEPEGSSDSRSDQTRV